MELVVRAFPLPESRIEDLYAFSRELLVRRRRDTDNLFRRFGVSAESWHIHRTAHGAVFVLTTWMEDVDRSPRAFASSRDPFHVWFKQQLLRLSGTDLSREPLGPPTEAVFEWRDTKASVPKTGSPKPARPHRKKERR